MKTSKTSLSGAIIKGIEAKSSNKRPIARNLVNDLVDILHKVTNLELKLGDACRLEEQLEDSVISMKCTLADIDKGE